MTILDDELTEVAALVLDVDDTIIDTRGAMVAAGTAAAAAVWPDADEHVAMAQRYHADPGRWFRRYASGELAFEQMRAERLREVADVFGLPLGEDTFDRYEAAYGPAFRRSQRLFDDVPDLLDAAEAVGLPVALLTNSAHEPTRVKLEALDLHERFEVVVTTDTLGFGKPDERVYLEVCARVGVAPARAVCVGDSLEWDVLGARSAGLQAVWLDREGRGTGEAVASVTSLGELAAAVRRRFGPPRMDR
ncbi:MAG: HAD family hydrolase [Terracoccus sp.]